MEAIMGSHWGVTEPELHAELHVQIHWEAPGTVSVVGSVRMS